MIFIEAVFIEDRRRYMPESVSRLAAFIPQTAQRHQEHGIGSRLGRITAARKQQRIGAVQLEQFFKQFDSLAGERDDMLPALFHTLSRDCP
ncbi:hypothetical protein D3C72_1954250 [compost metagenome]